jgi:phage-related protein
VPGPSVMVRILGDAKEFTKSMDGVQGVAGKVGSAVSGTLTSAFRLASTAMLAAGAATVAFGIDSFKTAARVGEMNATLRALSKGNEDVYQAMLKTVDGIRGQGIEAGVAQNLVAQFSRNQLNLADSTKLASVAQDAAVISGQNSSETLDQLIHGITTQNSLVLRNAGVNVQAGKAMDEYAASIGKGARDLSEAERAQAVLNAVIAAGEPIAGAYASAMEEPGKVLRSFPRLFDDIKVTVGEGLVNAFGPLILKLYDVVKAFSGAIKEGGDLRPILDALMDKVKRLVEPLIDLAAKAGDWIKKIPKDQIQKIADSIGGIGKAASGVGTALGVVGAKNIPILGQLLGSINPVVAGLVALFATTEGGQRAFKDLLAAVGPLISKLSGALMPVLTKMMDAISPLIPIVLKLAVTIIDNLLKAITPLIGPLTDMVSIIGGALGRAIEQLTPLFNVIGDALRDIMTAVAPLLPALGELVGAIIELAVEAIKPLVPPIVELIKAALIPLMPPLISLLKPITDLIKALSPIITLVAQLVGIIVTLISAALAPVIGWLAQLIAFLVNGLVGGLTAVIRPFGNLGDIAKSVFGWIRDNWPLLLAILTGPIGLAIAIIVKNFDTIKDVISAVVGWFSELPGRIVSALSGAAHVIWDLLMGWNQRIKDVFNIDLFEVGKRIIESLAKGIESAAGAVIDKAKSIADKVTGLWPFSPAKWGPFRDRPPERAGANVVRLIADGMRSQEQYLERAASQIANTATIEPSYLVGGANGAAGSQPAAGAALVIQNATFTDEADVDMLMRRTEFAVSAGRL